MGLLLFMAYWSSRPVFINILCCKFRLKAQYKATVQLQVFLRFGLEFVHDALKIESNHRATTLTQDSFHSLFFHSSQNFLWILWIKKKFFSPRSFNGHSGRILEMQSLSDRGLNVFLTSSIDKTIKVNDVTIK